VEEHIPPECRNIQPLNLAETPKKTSNRKEIRFGHIHKHILNLCFKNLVPRVGLNPAGVSFTVLPDGETDLVSETSCFNFNFKQEAIKIVYDSKRVLFD
jgi:hypothetical protein